MQTEFANLYMTEYTTNYLDPETGCPRWLPINEKPPLKTRGGKPFLKKGDLVQWQKDPSARGRWFDEKTVGTVLEARWCLADWMRSEGKEVDYYPEAVILWNDGDTSNTSQNCLVKITEKNNERQKKETGPGLRRQRRKTKVTGGAEKVNEEPVLLKETDYIENVKGGCR